jgi:hypothetical protein
MAPSFAHSMLERVLPVVASVVITVVLVLLLPGEESRPASGPDVAAGFLQAYERSRTAELYVTSNYTRTFNDGRDLSYEIRTIQRPPDDVMVVGAGSASGRLGGRIVRCNVGTGETPDCVDGGEAPPYDDVVAAEVDNLQTLLDEVYGIERDDAGCYILTLDVLIANPPYGGAARWCFDEASGALQRLEERHSLTVEVTEAVEIRTEVTDADLRPESLGDPIATG